MKKTEILIFPTFSIINHFNDIIEKVIAIKKSIQPEMELTIIFENRVVYDFEYFGYNIRNDYIKVIEAIQKKGFDIREISSRTLYNYAIQSARKNLVYLIGINIQQLRTLGNEMASSYKGNIVEILILNYQEDKLQSVSLNSPLEGVTPGIISFRKETVEETVESVSTLFNIDLHNYSKMKHGYSRLFFPEGNHGDMFKVLGGDFPESWVEKVVCMKELSKFCSDHKIPNCIPSAYYSSGVLLLKMPFIDGTSVAGMIGYQGLKENIGITDDDLQQRIPVAEYMAQLCRAINFYHFLGLYISDIKEDNFVYLSNGIIPIDVDGFSLFTFPSSQPRPEYRGKTIIPNVTPYFHTATTETYSLSFMLFKILFNKRQPLDFKDDDASLETWIHYDTKWYAENKDKRSERFTKEAINSWNALPEYIQNVFLNMFCKAYDTIECFETQEWLPLIVLYLHDLNNVGAVLDYRNLSNSIFRNSSKYDFETVEDLVIKEDISLTLLSKIKRALILINGITSLAIIGTIIYIFLLNN